MWVANKLLIFFGLSLENNKELEQTEEAYYITYYIL